MKNAATTVSLALFAVFTSLSLTVQAQVVTDVFDGVGDESYTGVNGFGAFNWVNALSFGFATQQGSSAFLSNLTGPAIPDIGMVKPFTATMDAGTYRVAFYCSRYSSPNTLAYADYDTLYIGSPLGTMVWDTVPTPTTDYQWVRWSGLYTTAPADIGQPFKFGFSTTVNNGTSFALDGPVTATDVTTGIITQLDTDDDVTIITDPSAAAISIRSESPIVEVQLFDARGNLIAHTAADNSTNTILSSAGLSAGLYVVSVRLADGTLRCTRVMSP